MSKIDKTIEKEINSLVEEGRDYLFRIQHPNLTRVTGIELSKITSWIVRLGQLIRNLYRDNSQYFELYTSALSTEHFYTFHSGYYDHFSRMLGIAEAIKYDLDNGLLVNFRTLAQAEVFSDFLEMGEYLLQEGYRDAAAVIIGGVLENGLRKLAEKNNIATTNDSGKPLTIEPLNAELAKREIYSKLIQKQITSWAHIRNKAAHGEYGEYNREQVQMMLLFVQNFVSDHLN